jgi:HEAT repeat protein
MIIMLRQRNNSNIHKLIDGLYHESSHERAKARKKLTEYGSDSLPALMEVFSQSNDLRVKKEAIITLRDIKDPIAAPFFIQALADTDRDIRWIAEKLLQKLMMIIKLLQ